MNGDLIAEISATKDIDHAIILTHNIDFLFLESVVMTALRHCGHPSLTIFADMGCCAETYPRQRPFIQGLGRRYRVVQVAVDPGFRFHPKALLLVGKDTGRLWVGSGNLTFGGWRENAEIWASFDAAEDGSGPFVAFHDYLARVLTRVPLSEVVEEFLERTFDPENHPWFDSNAAPSHLLGRAATGERSLLEQMRARLNGAVEKITLTSPYFDNRLEAASRFAELAPLCINLHATGATLPHAAFASCRDEIEFRCVRAPRALPDGSSTDPFIHAKAYAFTMETGEVQSFLGSANCSYAALLATGRRGNAELLVALEPGRGDLFEAFEFEAGEPRLVDDIDNPNHDGDGGVEDSLSVAGARLERDRLRVAVRATEAVEVAGLLVDGIPVEFEAHRSGGLSARLATDATRVEVIGSSPRGTVRSGEFWIDHETYLSASARGRALLSRIHIGRKSGSWDLEGWADVMTVFCSHVEDLPPPSSATGGRRENDEPPPREFDANDAYGRAGRLPDAPPEVVGVEHLGLRSSLHAALLRWFHGYVEDDDDASPEPPLDNASDPMIAAAGSEPAPSGTAARPEPPGPAKLQRAKAVLEAVSAALTNDDYLRLRQARHLGADLGIVSTLLRVALREEWIDATSFFVMTAKIWHALFISSSDDPTRGWMERREATAPDRQAFRDELCSPRLAAALAAWALGVPSVAGPQQTRFRLAQTFWVSRVPWLWADRNPEAIASELVSELRICGWTEEEMREHWPKVVEQWTMITAGGHAMAEFEAALDLFGVGELRNVLAARSPHPEIPRGHLCWQGRLGFCVVVGESDDAKLEVLSLARMDDRPTLLMRGYVVPVDELLDVIPIAEAARAGVRNLLRWLQSDSE